LICLLSLFASPLWGGEGEQCRLVEIYDGDTVTLKCGSREEERVRLQCIDAPEMGQGEWGTRARDRLAELLGGNFATVRRGRKEVLVPSRRISVELERFDIDRYGRTVAGLTRNRTDINLEMVERGAAAVYRKYCKDDRYYAAERVARSARLGIWRRPGLQQTPWEWRHR